MSDTGIVKIKGREYKTVALRVSEFREQYPAKDGWAITTEIVERNDERVVMKAMISNSNHSEPVATGFAEEKRSSSQINRTSALENCETSAIGRALAAFGLGGSEYASANEVQNAIHQQQQPKPPPEPVGAEHVAELTNSINEATDLPTIENTILRGKLYQRLKSNGPAADYARLSKLARAKHAVLEGTDNANQRDSRTTDTDKTADQV